jgi:hypothetical protein
LLRTLVARRCAPGASRFAACASRFAPGALLGLALLQAASLASAQVEHGGRPASARAASLRRIVPSARMRPVDRTRLLAEDERAGGDGALRFAEVLAVELGLRNAGQWERMADGTRVWRLRVESKGAFSIALVFSRYQLPEGAELFVYGDAREVVRGAYTHHENRLDGEFAIQPTPGEALTLEYVEPASVAVPGELVLSHVVHDYRDVLGLVQKSSSSAAGTCHVDVACPEGLAWQQEVDSVAHVLALPVGRMCSGSLLNNTANDGTALFITAEHCGNLDNGVFTFNYERAGCGTGGAPQTDTIVGSVELVADEALDFRLVRLAPLPAAFGARLAGWDRSDVPPANTATIHHPGGGPKKISLDDDPPLIDGTNWHVLEWDTGAAEGGSSGAPLYSPQGRFLGQLSFGQAACGFKQNDWFGRLAAQWALVEPYLDPLGTGALTLDGLDPASVVPLPFAVTGVAPQAVETLYPGLARPVRIVGAGFTDTSTVALDGVPLLPGAYFRGGNSWINVDMPQVDPGRHTFTVTEGAVSLSVDFDVVPASRPRFQIGSGEPSDVITSFDGVDLIHADQPGHVHYCLFSFSNVPSTHPRLSLLLGNNFTQLYFCGIVVIPGTGWLPMHGEVRGLPHNTTIYAQAVCLSHGSPFPASNLQQTLFLF